MNFREIVQSVFDQFIQSVTLSRMIKLITLTLYFK